jgi:hypothetical protein
MKLKLTPEQHAALLGGIFRGRVSHDPQGHSHLEQWDVRRTLIRVFGFGGWEDETLELTCVSETVDPAGTVRRKRNGQEYTTDRAQYSVVYRAQVRLTVYGLEGTSARYDDGAIGKAENQPSLGDAHDQALKTAQSQALKRCAVNLGDQFGMSLYNGGDLEPVVVRTLVGPAGASTAGALPRDDAPVRPEPGSAPDDDDVVDEPAAALPAPPTRPGTPLGERVDRQRDELAARRSGEFDHRSPEGRKEIARSTAAVAVNGHAAGQLPPPADDEPVHIAGARAVERARAQRVQNRPAQQPRREPERPAPRPAPSGDPEVAALVEAIVRASSADHVARLWAESASVRPQGRSTDIRGYLEHAVDDVSTAARLLGPIFAEIKVDPTVAIPVGALVVAIGKHLERCDCAMSLHDHVAADSAEIGPDGRAVTPPADAVPAR